MRLQYILLCTIFFLPCFLLTQQGEGKKDIRLFTIQQARLEYEKYKWGDELFLKLNGMANRTLDGSFLKVTLFYYNTQLLSVNLPLQYAAEKDADRILFSLDWGPLNQPYQRVFSGNYSVEVSFLLDHQVPHLRSKLQENLKNREVLPQRKAIPFGSMALFQEEKEYLQSFYRERVQKMKTMYDTIRKHSSEKRNVRNALDLKEWRKWLEAFIQEINTETQLLNKFQKKQFGCLYSITRDSLIEYQDLLARFAKLTSIELYQKHNVEPDKRDTNIASFGLKRLDMVQKNLERLLEQAMADLKSEKILGEKK